MFAIDSDKTILCTRGDAAVFAVKATVDGADYEFRMGDVLRFTVFEKKNCAAIVLSKDTPVSSASQSVTVSLSGSDTKIGESSASPLTTGMRWS